MLEWIKKNQDTLQYPLLKKLYPGRTQGLKFLQEHIDNIQKQLQEVSFQLDNISRDLNPDKRRLEPEEIALLNDLEEQSKNLRSLVGAYNEKLIKEPGDHSEPDGFQIALARIQLLVNNNKVFFWNLHAIFKGDQEKKQAYCDALRWYMRGLNAAQDLTTPDFNIDSEFEQFLAQKPSWAGVFTDTAGSSSASEVEDGELCECEISYEIGSQTRGYFASKGSQTVNDKLHLSFKDFREIAAQYTTEQVQYLEYKPTMLEKIFRGLKPLESYPNKKFVNIQFDPSIKQQFMKALEERSKRNINGLEGVKLRL